MLLRPHFKNFSKKLIKSPKLYFLDTGLLSYLLRIRSAEDLRVHSLYGSIFESYVISELLKNYMNRGEEHAIYFWRDSTGNELDVIIDEGDSLIPMEIKAGQTVTSDFLKGFDSGENYLLLMNNGRHWFTEERILIFDRKPMFIPGQYFKMISRLTEKDYEKALSRIEGLMDAKPGTSEINELELRIRPYLILVITILDEPLKGRINNIRRQIFKI